MRALVTGATGFVGGRLAVQLAGEHQVRCLVRDRSRASHLEAAGCELHEGDVLSPETLQGLGEGIDIAYYLIHSMGRGGDADFRLRDREAAENFNHAMASAGVQRVVYLGGLGETTQSKHLASRHETAEILGEGDAELTYFRAAMVVGSGSESYRTLRALVERLPVMVAPAWLRNPTQPIAARDVIAYLAAAASNPASAGREIQLGGPDVVSYGEMLDEMARALGKRPRPRLPVPLLTPWLSSLWIGLVTPVDTGVARPLVEGLATETVVTDPSGMALFAVDPTPFGQALRDALREDGRADGS